MNETERFSWPPNDQIPAKPDPLAVACPKCGSVGGRDCWDKRGPTKPHRARASLAKK